MVCTRKARLGTRSDEKICCFKNTTKKYLFDGIAGWHGLLMMYQF
jgi:hypothetical protein